MDRLVKVIAGKTETNGTWLPLWMHSMDMMSVSRQLFNSWLPGSVYRRLGKNMPDPEMKKLISFLSLVHDIGKITPCFQNKILGNQMCLKDNLTANGLLLNEEKECIPHSTAGEAILIDLRCPVRIAAIVGAHHGKPTEDRMDYESWAKDCVQRKLGDTKSNNRSIWKESRRKWLEFALETVGYTTIQDVPIVDFEQQVLLSGLVIMADWLASNTDFFPLINQDETASWTEERFDRAWKKIKLPDRWSPEIACMDSSRFQKIFGFSPNTIQCEILSVVSGMKTPGVLILEAPMGVGKTEAALSAAEVLSSRFGNSGLYFGLPTQATANGIFPRLASWAEDRIGGKKHTLRLAHGLAELNDAYAQFRTDNAHVSEEGLFVHEWFSGRKKALLSDFVIGTVDQLLMLALKQKHVMLRHLGMAGKVVIIDECHAYDAYMNAYLDRALMWLAAYDVSVVMLSATLPAERRKGLILAYLSGRGACPHETLKEYDAYPLITWTDGSDCYQRRIPSETAKKKIWIQRSDDAQLLNILKEPIRNGAAIGIICNTVRRAQMIQELIKTANFECEILMCHAQFLSEDRNEWESFLIRRLGKHSDIQSRKKLVVIGTQVLEQSLDIDFDVMITDLCPIDLLLQRVGRLHRHNRQRPLGTETPICYVLFPEEDGKNASELIYGKWLLQRTSDELPDTICLPDDISPLVQRVYETPQDINQETYCEYIKKNEDMYNRACVFRLGTSEDTPEECWEYTSRLNGMLDVDLRDDSEEKADAAVRDSISSVEVLVLMRNTYGEYHFLPWREAGKEIDANQRPDWELARAISRQRLRLPYVLSSEWNAAQTVKELRETHVAPEAWNHSPLLKDELFLFLDEKYAARIGDYILEYNRETGLTTRKAEENE